MAAPLLIPAGIALLRVLSIGARAAPRATTIVRASSIKVPPKLPAKPMPSIVKPIPSITKVPSISASSQDWSWIDEHEDVQERAKTLSKEMEDLCSGNPQKCKECPANEGETVVRNWNMSPRAREYQQFISRFPQRVEWRYNFVDFDGFWPESCTLVEAKDRYIQFFKVTKEGSVIVEITPYPFFSGVGKNAEKSGLNNLRNEALRQLGAIKPQRINLEWHCSQIAFSQFLIQDFLPKRIMIPIKYTPFSSIDPHEGYEFNL